MTEVERMTVELLEEMDDMSPEDIENFRREWFEKLEPEQIRNEKVDDYVKLCVMWQLAEQRRDLK